jgi:hypothetical protein
MTALEDEEYRVKYSNFGYEPVTWELSFTVPWLTWDEETKELHGTPLNNHVGTWDVFIEIDNEKGHVDTHDFTIHVINTPPNITTEPVTHAKESEEYYVDFNSSDDGQGEMEWSIIPNTGWISINKISGEVSGVPTYEDVGTFNVSIVVSDGHEGLDSLDFQLTVEGVNDPPRITTLDIKTGRQEEKYYRKYEAYDPDDDSPLTWSVETDAEFLTMESDTGILSGTPGKMDIGEFHVNVTVSDPNGASTSSNFTLTIENVNDMPYWIDVPEDVEISHGQHFIFDVNALDYDPDSLHIYSIRSKPDSDFYIDPDTGEIDWIASIQWFEEEPFRMEVTIEVTDGEMTNIHVFFITIIPTQSPSARLTGPESGTRTPSANTILHWEGSDPENEPITYDIYIHENQAFVDGMREEALHLELYEGESYTVSGVILGRTYYWIVVPYDGCTHGTCSGGARSFTLNNPPKINDVPDQETSTGSEFKFRVSTFDDDDSG